jgi:hypothetical protein
LVASERNLSDAYRVIVLRQNATEVLLLPEGMNYRLPAIDIPRDQRVAENVCAQVRTLWGEAVICISSEDSGSNYQIAEHWRSIGKPQKQAQWSSLSALSRKCFSDQLDYEKLQKAIQKLKSPKADKIREPFTTFGWFTELCAWADASAKPLRLRLNGEFRQLNTSGSFNLIRFETNDRALWFKAVGEPNQREFPITITLAELFPGYLPTIVATHNEWNGWLMKEVEGDALAEAQDVHPWCWAAGAWGELQVASIPYASRILAAGAHDLTPAHLSELVPDYMETMAGLMGRQTKIPPPVLGPTELALTEQCIQEALVVAQNLDLPNGLGHLDLNPWNIIAGARGCHFLDWAEAYVGIPFLSLQYVFEHYRRSPAAKPDGESMLRDEYFRVWEHVISPSIISEVLPFLPMLAVFAYAVADEAWRDPRRLEEPGYPGYLRSLTRRMFREASALKEQRSLCSD